MALLQLSTTKGGILDHKGWLIENLKLIFTKSEGSQQLKSWYYTAHTFQYDNTSVITVETKYDIYSSSILILL